MSDVKWPKKKCKQCGQANGEPCLDLLAIYRSGDAGRILPDRDVLPKRTTPHPARLPKGGKR